MFLRSLLALQSQISFKLIQHFILVAKVVDGKTENVERKINKGVCVSKNHFKTNEERKTTTQLYRTTTRTRHYLDDLHVCSKEE
jgi:hypothetical protein